MIAPQSDPAVKEGNLALSEEIDVWWGSYAGRTMTPSFAVCIVLTVLIYCGVRLWVSERGWLQLTFIGLASPLWLIQLARWSHRFFTWNYRVTTRFLYVDRGMVRLRAQKFPLSSVDRVEIRGNPLEKWLGIGDLLVWFDDAAKPPAVLEGVKGSRAVADTIREVVRKARENIN